MRRGDGGASTIPDAGVTWLARESLEGRVEAMNRSEGKSRRRWRRPMGLVAVALTALALAALIAVRRPGRGPNPVGEHLRAARQALSQGRLDEAAAELAEARQHGAPSGETERLTGLLYARAGRPDEALPWLRRAWDEPASDGRSVDPEVAEALARIAMRQFELAEAIAVLDRWAAGAPTDPKPLVMRAEVDRRIGVDRAVTIGHLREALRRDRDCDEARLALAEVLYLEGEHAESAGLYAAYAARHPDDSSGHIGVGIAARALGETARASAALDRALALAPDDTLALKERAAVDLLDGHPEDGLGRLDRAIKADPFDPELHYQRSLALGRLGRRDEADSDRRRSEQLRREHRDMAEIAAELVRSPSDDALRCRAARWMIEHGREEEAAQWARLVLRNRPGHPEANRLLADYHRRRGELGLANFYRSLAAPEPEPPASQTQAR
jgi:tetratricopeptide (TPR) repeat protein